MFYRILAQTPLEKLAQVDFIFATTLATFWAFAPWDMPFLTLVKLAVHPMMIFLLLSLFGPVRPNLGLHRRANGGVAAGAQRVRVRAVIRCLGRAGLERRADRHAGVGGNANQRDVDGENRYAAAASV
ncbi:MAG TPA: hypothetical protein VLN61_01995 [Pseudolabrys sp.]|nr:hypothetical protein [Pseudolabrys sp.]